jgi:hypothetical protein
MPGVGRRAARPLLALLAAATLFLAAHRASAQFSAREGFTADGTAHWSFEVAPYLYLPNVDATIGLGHPLDTDISIQRSRPTIAQLVTSLTGAFVGYSVARYGNWSAELNVLYVGVQAKKGYPPVVPGGPGLTLKSNASVVFVSPGFGYRVLPTGAAGKLAVDLRAGFSYNYLDANANFEQSRFGGINKSYSFVQPWVGTRVSYYPSPRWRLAADLALTGMGVDGGAIGWNGRLTVSYLIASWIDLTLGYAAVQTVRHRELERDGTNRSINLLAYGPVVAIGFRF